MIEHGVLPGAQTLDRLDGACSLAAPSLHFSPLGPTYSGRFYSRARRRSVGYSIALPPGHSSGDELPLVVMLHGYGNNHTNALVGLSPAQAVALRDAGRALPPTALVTVDGGNGYWNPHPRDDPMSMVVDELIPLCQRRGLGRTQAQRRLMGISMGGYGALAIAERHRGVVSAVAAISPAIWTSYDQAHAANAGAFASPEDFEAGDVVAHAHRLAGLRVRVASGVDDPFHPGVEAFAHAAPTSVDVFVSKGCHTNSFFLSQEPPSLRFVTRPT